MNGLGKVSQSTDEKLNDILNAPVDFVDDDVMLRNQKVAAAKLRRTSLYGQGARARIPKTRTPKSIEHSPFTTEISAAAEAYDKRENSAVPPGWDF